MVERDGRFLVVEELSEGRRVLNQPAGHVEPGEDLTAAVRRETLEETGWGFEPSHLTGIYLYRRAVGAPTYLRFCFCGRLTGRDPQRTLDPDILAWHWLSRADLTARAKTLRSPLVTRSVDDYLAGVRLPLDLVTTILDPGP